MSEPVVHVSPDDIKRLDAADLVLAKALDDLSKRLDDLEDRMGFRP